MVELRWAVPEGTSTQAPRLQYRQLPTVTFGIGGGWTEWQDVPFVAVPKEPPKPAPTALSALGVSAACAPRISFAHETGGTWWRLELNGVTISRHETRDLLEAAILNLRRALGVNPSHGGQP